MPLSDHSAPGSNAGFSFQFERALFWLAQCPAGAAVGVETADDVAIRGPHGEQALEQDKHSISEKGEPFGNRSRDLWNTLATWVSAVDGNEIDAGSTRFLMVTNKVLPDCIALQIGRAARPEEVRACIAELEAASKKPPKKIADLVPIVLSGSSRASLERVITNCETLDGSAATAGSALRKETLDRLPLPGWCLCMAESIADELLGWMHRVALQAWQQRRPAWILRNSFVEQLHAVMERRRREIVRERAAHLIPVNEEKVGKERTSLFVRQLQLVTEDDQIVDGAIREFIRCNIEKSRLSAEGNITDGDWKTFEETLLDRWKKIRARVARMKQGKGEADVGFEIFADTTEEHREKLAGSDTEHVYLTSGTYHRLAEMLRVGWHPRFEHLMQDLLRKV
jgi:hypothetical protein